MVQEISNVLIWSEDYKQLADWYINNLGFTDTKEFNHPNDTGILLNCGNIGLWIGQHSKVKGKNKDIHRHMIDFVVDSVEESYKSLKANGVKFLGSPHLDPTSNTYVLTVFDADNNLIQLVGKK